MSREIRGRQERTATFQREAISVDARTVELAISSEAPVMRWFGLETLGHAKGEINLARMKDGAPLLLDHNTRDVIGVVESIRLDEDKVLRGVVRFGKSARAEEIFQDVVDGIRSKVSVGYQIDEHLITKGKNGGPDQVRATLWTPMEASIVAIPADPTVGVGRSADALETGVSNPPAALAGTPEVRMEPETKTPAAPAAAPINIQELRSKASQETADFLAQAGKLGATEKAQDLIRQGVSLDQARGELLKHLQTQPVPAPTAVVDMTEKEQRAYSIGAAMRAFIGGQDCAELEVSRAIAKKLGRDTDGFFVPTFGAKIAGRANPPMDSATAAYGQKLVFAERGDFIDLLRARTKVLALGATFLPGLRGNLTLPRQIASNTATWTAENPAAAVTPTALQTDLLTLTPKQILAQSSITKTLLNQSTPEADALIMRDLALVHAIALDQAAINGSGAPAPTGILNTAGIGDVAGGTNGLAPTWDHLVELEAALASANADVDIMALLTTPGVRGKLKRTQKFASTNGDDLWKAFKDQGYRAEVSNNVPNTLVKGTSGAICHALIFGNWPELMIGEWGAFEILTDPYTQAGKGLVVLTSSQFADCGVRHAASFSAMKDALTA